MWWRGWALGVLVAATMPGAGLANDAPASDVLPDIESAVLAEINWARAHPQDYARELRAYRDSFIGDVAYPDEAPMGVSSREGPRAVDEAADFMERQAPLPPLMSSPTLAMGAALLVDDQSVGGGIGHVTRAGLSPSDRVRMRGGDVYVAEVISYGNPDPRTLVRNLIIDDGVPRRGHRALIFTALYRYAGAACGPHPVHGAMCAIDMGSTPTGAPRLPGSAEPVAAMSVAAPR